MEVLITGSNGFLGKCIVEELKSKFSLTTLSRKNSDYNYDLTNGVPILKIDFDYVIHVAGKAHIVPKNKSEEEEFFDVNLNGTKNLLKSLEKKPPKTFVFISTVAVYGKEFGEMLDENTPLLGSTAYAKSKILAEKEVLSFGEKHNMSVVILRPPLVIGKLPEGNLKALINAIKKGYYFRIGKGEAKRSMVSAKDISKLIVTLYGKKGIYNLTDGRHPSFKEIDTVISNGFNKKVKILPVFFIKILAKIGDLIPLFPFDTYKYQKMTSSLTFSDDKAVKELNWFPENALESIEV